jgi:hypothetical protein
MASRVNLLADPNREGTHRYLCVVARTIEALVYRRPGPTSSTTVPRSPVAQTRISASPLRTAPRIASATSSGGASAIPAAPGAGRPARSDRWNSVAVTPG